MGVTGLLRGSLWACAGGQRGCRAWSQAPVSSASLAAWMCWHFASRSLGLSPSSGERPTFPMLGAFSAPSSGAFFLGPGVQGLRKPLLVLLLPVLLSPALLALLSAPPSAGSACVKARASEIGGASEISHRFLGWLVGKEVCGGSFLGACSFHTEIPGSVLCFPAPSLSAHWPVPLNEGETGE